MRGALTLINAQGAIDIKFISNLGSIPSLYTTSPVYDEMFKKQGFELCQIFIFQMLNFVHLIKVTSSIVAIQIALVCFYLRQASDKLLGHLQASVVKKVRINVECIRKLVLYQHTCIIDNPNISHTQPNNYMYVVTASLIIHGSQQSSLNTLIPK